MPYPPAGAPLVCASVPERGHHARCGSQSTSSDTARCYSRDCGECVALHGSPRCRWHRVRALTCGEARRGRGPGGPPPCNPFLPYDEALWVVHLSASHTLLLNKFNVVRHHLLVVTRAFEPQAAPLSAGDLGATWRASCRRGARARRAVLGACGERAALPRGVVRRSAGARLGCASLWWERRVARPPMRPPRLQLAARACAWRIMQARCLRFSVGSNTPERRLVAGRLSSHSKAG
jgi:hypothetical protein